MKKSHFYAVLIITSISITATLITSSRVLSSFYGASIYPESVCIAFTLIALSAGLFLGGRKGKEWASTFSPAYVLAGAGVWMLLLPFLRGILLKLFDPTEPRLVIILSSLLLYGPLFLSLGMIFMYLFHQKTGGSPDTLKATGELLALLLLIAAVFTPLCYAVLLPVVGIAKLSMALGLCLLIEALIIFWENKRPKPKMFISILVLIAGAAGLCLVPNLAQLFANDSVENRQSPYGAVDIRDEGNQRLLRIDGLVRNAMNTDVGKAINSDVVAMDLIKYLFPEPGDALIIGLGAGGIAQSFADDRWNVEVAEIDPQVIRMARDYFGLTLGQEHIFQQDARQFLRTCNNAYDAIIIDPWGSSCSPSDLLSAEAFSLIKSRLSPQGVVAIDLLSLGWDHRIVRSIAATLRRSFSDVIALPTVEPPNASGRILLIAADRKIDFPEQWIGHPLEYIDDPYGHWVVVQRNHAWDNRYIPEVKGARILTDDKNQLDCWIEEINYAAKTKGSGNIGRELWH
jgi:spermidine synthase